MLKVLVVEAVEQEIHKIRHHGFSPLFFKKLHNMVVGKRRELYKDFSYDSNLRLFFRGEWNIVKVTDNALYILTELKKRNALLGKAFLTDFLPFLMYRFRCTGLQFIRSCGIEKTHKEVSIDHTLQGSCKKRNCDFKARSGFHPVGI